MISMQEEGRGQNIPYRASVRGRSYQVRAALPEEAGTWIWDWEGHSVPIDIPSDFTLLVPAGTRVIIDYGPFTLTVWQEGPVVRYRGEVCGVAGIDCEDEELALWDALARAGGGSAPPACFFCRWSEVEPSSGWGHLGCHLSRKIEYDLSATSLDARRRKWAGLNPDLWVDEWFYCPQFELRPPGYGYRGRPTPLSG